MKVVIAGAGLAGLTAATRLLAAGHDVVVLEGRDEIGGRSRSRRVDSDVIELGGQHVSRHHRRMRRLIAEAGLHIQRDRYLPGPVNWRLPHDRTGRLIPRVTPRELLALRRLVAGPSSIWSVSAAQAGSQRSRDALDALSVADWFDQLKLSGSVRHLVDCFVSDGGGGVDPSDISLLQFTDFLTRESGIVRFAVTGMGLHGHIVEGTSMLCAHLAKRIGPRLRLCAAVTAVEQDDRGVALHTQNGDTVHGDHAIIAVPTPVLADITFTPELPESIRSVNAKVRYGQGTKIAAVVNPRRLLQPKGFIGGTMVRAGWRTDRVLYGFANTTLDEPSPPALTDDLCRAFGVSPDAVQHVEIMPWSHDAFTRGTYVYLPPGQYASLRRSLPHNYRRVRFAGAERSSWPTWMEGAVESGEDAANAIVANND